VFAHVQQTEIVLSWTWKICKQWNPCFFRKGAVRSTFTIQNVIMHYCVTTPILRRQPLSSFSRSDRRNGRMQVEGLPWRSSVKSADRRPGTTPKKPSVSISEAHRRQVNGLPGYRYNPNTTCVKSWETIIGSCAFIRCNNDHERSAILSRLGW